jgi:hypothetical protein
MSCQRHSIPSRSHSSWPCDHFLHVFSTYPSDYFAALNRGTILAFESRYATTLYERGCLLVNRRDPRWRGTVDDLREVMGIPTAKYRDWADIRRKVVEPACAEVNQLAHFVAAYRVDAGPRGKVGAIEFTFRKKDLPAIEAARLACRAGTNRSGGRPDHRPRALRSCPDPSCRLTGARTICERETRAESRDSGMAAGTYL